MAIKKAQQLQMVHGEYYDLEGVISPDRTTRDGSILEGVRKFAYDTNKIGLSISLRVHDTVNKRTIIRYVDAICFKPEQFDDILKLNLSEGDNVNIFGRCSQKTDGNGFSIIVEDAGWVTAPSSI